MKNQLLAAADGKTQMKYRAMKALCKFWKLSDSEAAVLLNMTEHAWTLAVSRRSLHETDDSEGRVGKLVRIYHLVGDMYPNDMCIAFDWIKRINRKKPFDYRTPLETMCSGGLTAITRVRDHLEGLFVEWGAIRKRGLLTVWDKAHWLNWEEIDIIARMMLRIKDEWQLSPEELVSILKVDEKMLIEISKQEVDAVDGLAKRMRALVGIAGLLCDQTRSTGASAVGIREANANPLFAGNTPLDLLASESIGIHELIYQYLRNI